jgi:hypothetical protein
MKAREMIRLLEEDGWAQVRVPGKPARDLPPARVVVPRDSRRASAPSSTPTGPSRIEERSARPKLERQLTRILGALA